MPVNQYARNTRSNSNRSAVRRMENAERIAKQILRAEDTMRRIDTQQTKRKGRIMHLGDKNEIPAPNDFVDGKEVPNTTMYPGGCTYQEAQAKDVNRVKMTPSEQDPFLNAGGHKAGIKLNTWQTIPPKPDVADSHPPLVPEPTNSMARIPKRAINKPAGPIPKKSSPHPRLWAGSVKASQKPYMSQHMS